MVFIRRNNLARTSLEYLTEFSDAFRASLVLADPETWASKFGIVESSNAPLIKYPIPLDAPGFKEFKGEMKYRRLYERALSMYMKTFQDGVEEVASIVEGNQFSGWGDAPGNMSRAWAEQDCVLAAEMLVGGLDANGDPINAAGPLLDYYADVDSRAVSTKRLFAVDHLCNPLDLGAGTFDNTMVTTPGEILSGQFFEDADNRFAQVNGFNGRPLGLRLVSALVDSRERTLFKRALEPDTLLETVNAVGARNATGDVVAAAVRNNMYKYVTYEPASLHRVGSTKYFYVFGARKDGSIPPPWVIQKQSTPEEIIRDKSSDYYKETNKISIGYRGEANVAAALPHAIIRVELQPDPED